MAADPLYDDDHPKLVASTVKTFLDPGFGSRALIAIPLRDATTKSLALTFKKTMEEEGLELANQGEEICFDDWQKADDVEDVRVWWGIWKWASADSSMC